MATHLVRRVSRTLSGLLPAVRRATFRADADVVIGRNVHIGRNVTFRSRHVRIGDGTVIHDDVLVESERFEIGDYGTIYRKCFFPGPGELRIGHNFWLGDGSIVDAKGGTTIGDNVGIGGGSQLWTHMVYGDVMAGCRFHSARSLDIGNDVWLVGHCLVSPVTIGDRSLAMLGSLVTKDMAPDRCYGGTPAVDITDKVGPQFERTTVEQRRRYLEARLEAFCGEHGGRHNFAIAGAEDDRDATTDGKTVFDVASRTYRKTGSDLEYRCIRWLLPEAKFLPE